jgi:hypothetical protein
LIIGKQRFDLWCKVPVADYVATDYWHYATPINAEASPGSRLAEVGFIRSGVTSSADYLYLIDKSARVNINAILQLNRTAATETPWMCGEKCAIEISDGDPMIIPAGVIGVLNDGDPNETL